VQAGQRELWVLRQQLQVHQPQVASLERAAAEGELRQGAAVVPWVQPAAVAVVQLLLPQLHSAVTKAVPVVPAVVPVVGVQCPVGRSGGGEEERP
jgi:hypothetical protein